MAAHSDYADVADADAHPEVGINAKRGCTDCWATILFMLFWAGMVLIAFLGFSNGHPHRLVYGTDFMGKTCAHGEPPGGVSASDWKSRNLLWYPITFDYKRMDMVVLDALQLGVCVSECPLAGTVIEPYGPSVNATDDEGPMQHMPKGWPVLFDSSPTLHRCIPAFLSFDCQNATECAGKITTAESEFLKDTGIHSILHAGFNEVISAWWIILAGLVSVAVLSFLWLFILRRLVKPVVCATIALVFVALLGLAGLFFYLRRKHLSLSPPQESQAKYYMIAMIVVLVVALLYGIIVAVMAKGIMTACDIIEEATKVPLSIPTMLFIPPVATLIVLPFVAFHVITAVFVQCSSEAVNVTVPVPHFQNPSAPALPGHEAWDNFSFDGSIEPVKYEAKSWRTWAMFYNIFMFLWTFGFINAVGFMVLSLCASYWYWSFPGDNKKPPMGAVLRATATILIHHTGTAAIGSLIVAIVQVIRIFVAFLERKLTMSGPAAETQRFVLRVLQCCLACLERIVKFINKNAYVVCAMTGKNFISSARLALELLMANALCVGPVTVISEYVMTFGKILVTVLATLITYGLLRAHDKTSDSLTGGVLILSIVFVIGYLVSTVFANVFSVCIDTVLMCFCYDRSEDGRDYYPSDLAKHIDASTLRRGADLDAKDRLLRVQRDGLHTDLDKPGYTGESL